MVKRLLIHAAEEAGEFIQAAMKKARNDWGLKNLTDEAADTAAFITLMQEQGLIDGARFAQRKAMKLNKFRRKYARKS
jgi:NTP pyrophosphatase (non-canonical NTP hydrolase)